MIEANLHQKMLRNALGNTIAMCTYVETYCMMKLPNMRILEYEIMILIKNYERRIKYYQDHSDSTIWKFRNYWFNIKNKLRNKKNPHSHILTLLPWKIFFITPISICQIHTNSILF